MKVRGVVKDGVIVPEGQLPEGLHVSVEYEFHEGPVAYLDENDELIMTPELEAEIAAGEAEADRGEGIPAEVVLDRLGIRIPRR